MAKEEIPDAAAEPLSARLEVDEFWDRMLMGLLPLDRLIVMLHYCWDLTLGRIGQYLDLAESRISQRRNRAIAWPRKARADVACSMQRMRGPNRT